MSLLASWLASSPPDAAVEIAPERVSAATMRAVIHLNVESHATKRCLRSCCRLAGHLNIRPDDGDECRAHGTGSLKGASAVSR